MNSNLNELNQRASDQVELAPVFFAQAQRNPCKVAIHYEGDALSYADLARFVCRWSNAMAGKGVARGDHIGVLLPNGIEFIALMLAAADLGAVLVPLNTSLTADSVCKAFEAADVLHVVASSALLAGLPREDFPMAAGLWLAIGAAAGALSGVITLDDLLKTVADDVEPLGLAQADDAFILTMTSGSTGDPKPIILTQRTKFNRAAAAITLYGITQEDRTLAATPLYHSLAERLVLIPLLTGGTSVLMATFSASAWLKCVSTQSVTFTIAVSSQLKQIVEQMAQVDSSSMASLRCVVSSSALLEAQLKADLLAKLDCAFHECYGASEIAIASNLDGASTKTKLNSVGVAAPGVDIKILDADDAIAKVGEPGEIVCRTTMLFGGYFKRPDLTRAAMWGDYFRTGDIGKLDADGFLYFLGRKKDIIITGGINVYPADIESVLAEHPSILEAAAFAYPDKRLGEIVAVAIVARDAASFDANGDLRKVRFHCAERLADFQQPRKFFLVDVLPRNSMGKLMKFQLANTFSHTATSDKD